MNDLKSVGGVRCDDLILGDYLRVVSFSGTHFRVRACDCNDEREGSDPARYHKSSGTSRWPYLRKRINQAHQKELARYTPEPVPTTSATSAQISRCARGVDSHTTRIELRARDR